jgi:hypothetical protein
VATSLPVLRQGLHRVGPRRLRRPPHGGRRRPAPDALPPAVRPPAHRVVQRAAPAARADADRRCTRHPRAGRPRRPGAAVPDGPHRQEMSAERGSTSPARSSTSSGCGGPRRWCGPPPGAGARARRRASTSRTSRCHPPARTSRTPRCPRRSTTSKAEGIKRLTTETGAGQWGTALSFATAQYGLECKVYMVRNSFESKPYRKMMMETWGAECVPSPVDDPSSPGSLGMAISDAVADAVQREDTHYALGSVLNHVLLHQTIIGLEAKEQLAMAGETLPDVVIAPCGGGSNLGGPRPAVHGGRGPCGWWRSSRRRAPRSPRALRVRLRRHRRHDPDDPACTRSATTSCRPPSTPAGCATTATPPSSPAGEDRAHGGRRLPAGQGVRGGEAVRHGGGPGPQRPRPATASGPPSTRRWPPRRRARRRSSCSTTPATASRPGAYDDFNHGRMVDG